MSGEGGMRLHPMVLKGKSVFQGCSRQGFGEPCGAQD